ncbi:MAG: sigma-70 family RNA polymerase sigma factor, partial [Bacteroidales bacterium]|nr:sigma-70 family RNA polymerase sigma factor [Bacteroidales bacterium]
QLWRSFPHFRGDAKLSSWIYKISLNTCISFVRKKKRKPISVPLNLEVNIYDENFEKKQQLEELYNLINKLNKLEKSVILLWLEERSYDEIAFITVLSRANVATKLHRIKEKLKDMSNQ